MDEAQAKAIRVIAEGEPFEDHWYDDGDVESGPSGGTLFGYKLGDEIVELSRNGSVFFHNGLGLITMIHNSSLIQYTGVGSMIADHLRAIERNATRNGLEFVKTGRSPTEGYYSRDEIIKREERMREERMRS